MIKMQEFKKYFKKIYKKHASKLKNLNKVNKKLLICFAGIPCSGKTALAKKIERKYKAVRISNNDLRRIINKYITKKEDKREAILKEYVLDLLKNSPFANRLVVLDSGIERKYKDILKISKSKKWKMFIIRMIVPKSSIIKRIKIKDIKRFENHPEDIKRWFKEYKEFNRKYKSDFIFKSNKDLKKLFTKLNSILY